MQKYLFTDATQVPQLITRMQSTPMLPPVSSRLTTLPLEFELSPIIRQDNVDHQRLLHHKKDQLKANSFNISIPIGENDVNTLPSIEEATACSGFVNIPENTHIELSTWIGGKYH